MTEKDCASFISENLTGGIITMDNIESQELNYKDFSFAGRVLLVEDSPISRIVSQEALSSFGLDVDWAENGEEAVEKIKSTRYDIVFMDCQMPIMDGFEATTAVRKLEEELELQRTPVVALTALSALKERMHCTHSGTDDYLAKPFEMNSLFLCLKKWLSAKMQRRS